MAEHGIRTLKIWVAQGTKISGSIMRAIIDAAHRLGVTSFAHVYFRDDVAALIEVGIGVRIDPAFARTIADSGATLLPTRVREETHVAFAQADNFYLKDAFYRQVTGSLLGQLHIVKNPEDLTQFSRNFEIAQPNFRACAM